MAKKLAFDKILFTTTVVLVGLGLVMVYSASAALVGDHGGAWNPFLFKQVLACAVGLVAMLAAMHLDYRRLRRPAIAYSLIGAILLLLVVVLSCPTLNNTRRWFFVGGISVQPSELAKLALVVFLAYQLDRKHEWVNSPRLLFPCFFFAGLTAGLVLLEPDMGTALLLVAVTVLMLFLAGLAWRYLAAGLLLAAPLVWFLVLSVTYRRERLLAFLAPEKDPLGGGFQALQSLIAVGSGGMWGRGPGASVQKLYFLPYPHSDFIYAILAEELGMAGALAVVLLFALFAWRGVRAGLQAPELFGRYLAWGMTSVVVLQGLVNVSVALALLPTKGIPLPFVSYGGSSLVVSMIACGVILNVSQHG